METRGQPPTTPMPSRRHLVHCFLLEPAAAREAWTAHDAGGAVIHSAAQAGSRRKARAAAIEGLRALGDQPDPREDR